MKKQKTASDKLQKDGHYPYQAPIDAYGNGGFRFAQMSHRGSLLCLPDGMFAWDVDNVTDIDENTLAPVLKNHREIDVLLVGLGTDIVLFDPKIRQILRDHNIIVDAVGTGGAVRTYNILLAENRAVAAALISVHL
ncbi:FIG020313: hypothetical protein [hydrothermal vent metagenome]|uniref:Uncharacterized protein n=1 Tax=hydrothermal vent metagenome TaxID=652676 RepID=A0A3B0TF08_9ZZZZ